MKIGITERGDAGIDLSWYEKLSLVDGTILITKNITPGLKYKLMQAYLSGKKIILHCTCTGWGNTAFEPNVPAYHEQLNQLKILISEGFPATNCVLRIDPIFPTESGLKQVENVLEYFASLNTGISRIRISVYDEYKHVKERLKKIGCNPCYGNSFYASPEQIKKVGETLSRYPYKFETCAEDILCTCYPEHFSQTGCVSTKDLDILGLDKPINMNENGQNRYGCHCLGCKTGLLENKHRCPHQCVYCYWKD